MLFESLDEFMKHLDRVHFDKYAGLKAKSNAKFNDYPALIEMMGEIKKLKCVKYCREGGCKQDCKVRACAISKGFEGCWGCDSVKDCDLLIPLKNIHPSLTYNLEMIGKYGIDSWSPHRGKHYIWSRQE
jgi:hypothetical protein